MGRGEHAVGEIRAREERGTETTEPDNRRLAQLLRLQQCGEGVIILHGVER